MKKIIDSAFVIAKASGLNPALACCVVGFFYIAANVVMAHIETLVWGERFPHWFDIPVMMFFIAYSGLTVWTCAAIREQEPPQ